MVTTPFDELAEGNTAQPASLDRPRARLVKSAGRSPSRPQSAFLQHGTQPDTAAPDGKLTAYSWLAEKHSESDHYATYSEKTDGAGAPTAGGVKETGAAGRCVRSQASFLSSSSLSSWSAASSAEGRRTFGARLRPKTADSNAKGAATPLFTLDEPIGDGTPSSAEDDQDQVQLSEREIELARKLAFFRTERGQADRNRDYTLGPSELPYYMGWGLATADWDSLLLHHWLLNCPPTSDRSTPTWPTRARWDDGQPPARVLDVGCGIWAHWILHAARCWPTTTFVGLDVAPVLLCPEDLAPEEASRVQFVQHNILQGLEPIEPVAEPYDLVRMSFAGMAGVPEDKWDPLLAALLSLLTPTGRLEIVESELDALVSFDPNDPPPPAEFLLVRDVFDVVAERRGIGSATFANIRSALAVNARGVTTSGKQLVAYPPMPRSLQAGDAETDWEVLLPLMNVGFLRARRNFYCDEYALSLKAPTHRGQRRFHAPATRSEVTAALATFEGALQAAPLAPVLSERWGWDCTWDSHADELLTADVFELTDQHRQMEHMWNGRAGMDEEEEDELILARAQLALHLREARAEREQVRGRLRGAGKGPGKEQNGKGRTSKGEGKKMAGGALGLQSWVASRPA